ncbi:hypothetical protein F4604DRAFT_912746 [Suillus subluteus]|nr:hypothetical protein F4604DRAFT_912746 [Suillus subluteus]
MSISHLLRLAHLLVTPALPNTLRLQPQHKVIMRRETYFSSWYKTGLLMKDQKMTIISFGVPWSILQTKIRRSGQRKSCRQGLPWPWVYMVVLRACIDDPVVPIHVDHE